MFRRVLAKLAATSVARTRAANAQAPTTAIFAVAGASLSSGRVQATAGRRWALESRFGAARPTAAGLAAAPNGGDVLTRAYARAAAAGGARSKVVAAGFANTGLDPDLIAAVSVSHSHADPNLNPSSRFYGPSRGVVSPSWVPRALDLRTSGSSRGEICCRRRNP